MGSGLRIKRCALQIKGFIIVLQVLPRSKIIDHEFLNDVKDFFSERRAGHLSKWLYSDPLYPGDKACGAVVWQRIIEDARNGSDYYVFRDEEEIINSSLAKISGLFASGYRLIDLGPGSADAVKQKVIPIIESADNNIQEYVAVDVCKTTLDNAVSKINKLFKSLETEKFCKDFFKDTFFYGSPSPCIGEVAVFFGLTLGNMTIDPRVKGLPELLLTDWLNKIRSHFSTKQNYLIVTQDINNEPISLKKAYKACAPYYYPLLHRIYRDIEISEGYNPDSFHLEVDYFPETKACALCFVADASMEFCIEDEYFSIAQGQRLYFHNAFKFDIQTFINCANMAGFDVVFTERLPGNPCVLHALKAR